MIVKCLGSLEIRKIGISFIIGYHTLNQLKEMPYVQQTALEKIPGVHPRYITDNRKQFTGKEFQYFIA